MRLLLATAVKFEDNLFKKWLVYTHDSDEQKHIFFLKCRYSMTWFHFGKWQITNIFLLFIETALKILSINTSKSKWKCLNGTDALCLHTKVSLFNCTMTQYYFMMQELSLAKRIKCIHSWAVHRESHGKGTRFDVLWIPVGNKERSRVESRRETSALNTKCAIPHFSPFCTLQQGSSVKTETCFLQ